jgi:apyrase
MPPPLRASLFTVPFLFYLFSTAQKIHQSAKFAQPKSNFFNVFINASPIGARARVFEFLGEGRISLMDGTGSSSMKVCLGLLRPRTWVS